jgi:hypothetical protein
MNDEIETIRIGQKEGPTIKARGRLLDELDAPRKSHERWLAGHTLDRWFGGHLWETVGGAYIADSIHFSDIEGEDDHHRAIVLGPEMDEFDRRMAVMAHFSWTPQARAMAKRLGWKLVVEVS